MMQLQSKKYLSSSLSAIAIPMITSLFNCLSLYFQQKLIITSFCSRTLL